MTFYPPHCWRETGAHSEEIVLLFNNHFSVMYWFGNSTDNCIMFAVHFMNLLIPLMN